MGNCCALEQPRYYSPDGQPLSKQDQSQFRNKQLEQIQQAGGPRSAKNRLSTIQSSVADDVPDDY